ncbi:LPXTG cell wall anchor domain-containing protein [Limosilactobacillus balticus]|uniref:LPXTG cell wall anchor domain-containing protein n=1 Tax=Limosilactobacillus balticus TaxID=2759747 RepID=UPI001E3A0D50|nr:LPXTG cell wall anchor domain-containing protein [Limosilactobacillus balticus]MCD7135799.1 LPXTG cell wall anchor domain-containing protein [Limosilactobacillus balticus]
MKKRRLKKSLATTATVVAVTTGVTAISNSAKADTVQKNKNTIQQTLPDVNQQAQQNVCAAQDAVNKANADVATANNRLNIANQNLADADSKAEVQEKISNSSNQVVNNAQQEYDNVQSDLTKYQQEYQRILKVPVFYLNTMMNSDKPLVFDLANYDGYKGQNAQAEKNFKLKAYQDNIDLLKEVIRRNQSFVDHDYKNTPAYYNLGTINYEINAANKELTELNQIMIEKKKGTFNQYQHYHDWITKDRSRSWLDLESADISDIQEIIDWHHKIIEEDQKKAAEVLPIAKKELETGNYYLTASKNLLPQLEEVTNNLIETQEKLTYIKSNLDSTRRKAWQDSILLSQIEGDRANAQSQAINAQTKLLQALLNKTNSQEKLASAKEKLPTQTDALKYSSLIKLEPLTIEPGETPLPKVTTAIAVENDHQNKAVITLPGAEQENKLPRGTKVVWKDDTKVADDLQHPGKYTEDVLIIFPDGSVILSSEQVTVTAIEKQIDVNKETLPVQETVDPVQENNKHANDLSAQIVEVNNDNLVPEILVTPQTKQTDVQSIVKNHAALNNTSRPSSAKSFAAKTTNNALPRTGDESSLPIIALGAVIGLVGIGAALKRYE